MPAPAQPAGPPAVPARGPRPAVAAVWVLAFVLSVWAVQRSGAPVLDILRYAAYFAGGVTLPGVLLLRACTSGRRTWAEDVGLGSAVGLGYELAGWAVWTAAGLPWMQLVWALAVPVVFAAAPRLRRYWRAADAPRLSLGWSAGLAVVVTAAVGFWYGWSVQVTTVPPGGSSYYPDLLWHLALVHEAGRSVPPQIPQVAGETMHYHWFADAHLASAAHITGLDPRLIVFRLWFAPMVVTLVLCIAALARQVAKAWWAGPAAAAVAVVVTRVSVWDHPASAAVMPAYFLSPSQTYGSTLSVAVAVLLIGVLYQSAPRRAWLPVVLLVCASAGAKPTTIPLLLGGTGLAAVFLLVRRRQLHRPSVVPSVVTLAALVVVAGLAALAVTGSTAGTAVRLLGALRIMPGYAAVTGDTSYPGPDGGAVIAGLEHPGGLTVEWTIATVLALLVAMATCVVPLLVLAVRRTRTDPVHWWLLGALAAGWLGFLLIDHPGAAEYYFLGSAVPFGAVSSVAVVVAGLSGRPRRVRRTVLAACFGAAVVVTVVIRWFGNVGTEPAPDDGRGITTSVARPLIWFGVVVLLALAGWAVLRARRPAVRGLGTAVVAAAAVCLALAGRAPFEWKDALIRHHEFLNQSAGPPYTVAENEAADWVAHNVPEDDTVATNTLCVLPRKPDRCDARGYLVSGIGGRRTFIEGWAYTQQSMKNQQPGLRYTELPSPWPDRVRLTHRAIARPSEQALADLRARGVGWLFVDIRFSRPDTARLSALADKRFSNRLVQIYQLR